MKMEKISDNQIRFTLTNSDLISRNINISDLTYESEKTRLLFNEILDEARKICNFKLENTPLMIEAMPVEDGIMIIISKVENNKNLKNGFDFMPESKNEGRYRLNDYIEVKETPPDLSGSENNKISVFAFSSIDNAAKSAKRISEIFFGESSLYKDKNTYYLLLTRNAQGTELESDNMEILLSEYGTKQVSTSVSRAYVIEHSEPIVKADAVNILSTIF